ncbi:MAG TPA: response regulator [Rhodanobacteraceae bacterium]|nr:response regulator [Rhodanobacteraceae bacterium]
MDFPGEKLRSKLCSLAHKWYGGCALTYKSGRSTAGRHDSQLGAVQRPFEFAAAVTRNYGRSSGQEQPSDRTRKILESGRSVEPFFSTKGAGKGTGLGLSMVHGLAEQSGGAFRLHSSPGKGTCSDLWLPAGGSAPAPLALAAPTEIEAASATVLLVDDDALIANSTAALLEDLGHRVAEAHSGEEALVLMQDGLAPDIVVTDYAMPGMTGMDLAVALRKRHPKLPILLAIGYAELQGAQAVELSRIANLIPSSNCQPRSPVWSPSAPNERLHAEGIKLRQNTGQATHRYLCMSSLASAEMRRALRARKQGFQIGNSKSWRWKLHGYRPASPRDCV